MSRGGSDRGDGVEGKRARSKDGDSPLFLDPKTSPWFIERRGRPWDEVLTGSGTRKSQVDGRGSSDVSPCRELHFGGRGGVESRSRALERCALWLRSAWKNVSVEHQEPANRQTW